MVKFDPILAVRSKFPNGPPEGMRSGPCAMGPTAGDEPTSMHVWVFQHREDGGLALSSGDARQSPGFTAQGESRWKVRTALDPASKEFELDKPAVAVAIALVNDGSGTDVKQWSQAVVIAETSDFPGRDPA
jgi:hypothetical protein